MEVKSEIQSEIINGLANLLYPWQFNISADSLIYFIGSSNCNYLTSVKMSLVL